MKAILFVFMLPFTMLFSGQPTVTSDLNPAVAESYELLKKVEIDVEIDIGRKKKGCSGFGVCKISGSAGVIDIFEGPTVMGRATAEDGNITSITFLKASMNKKTLQTYFSGDSFLVGEDFSATFTHKGQKFILNLKAGKYPIQQTKNGFNIGMPPTLK